MPLPPLPSRPVLVAHPGEAMSTAEAFREIAAERSGVYTPEAALLELDALRSWEGVAGLARNDFEPVVIRRIPALARGLAAMREGGARIALLAGSGSSIFGIFDDEAARDAAAVSVEALGMRTWRVATLDEG
jgi:4-diphosphocytidyl-2-C-methyl-D-erythritol kinase